MHFYWSEFEIREKLEKKMREATIDVYTISQKHVSYLRARAYIIALKRDYIGYADAGDGLHSQAKSKFDGGVSGYTGG